MKLHWIEPENYKINTKEQYRASYVRKMFQVTGSITSAKLYATAHGVYIPYLNQHRCSGEMLLPYFTDYHRRTQYQEFDITSLIIQGTNIFIAEIGDGWYRGNIGAFNKMYVYGTKLAFAGKIVLTYEDGTREVIETDNSWEASQDGPLGKNDLKIAEVYDARKEHMLWDISGDMAWHEVKEADYPEALIGNESEPVIEQERFPAKILYIRGNEAVLDFGQNLAGHVQFTVTGAEGHQVEITLGEALDKQGNFTLQNIQGNDEESKRENAPMRLGQHLTYILKEGTQTFASHFLISGYRYARLVNWPQEVKAENFISVAVYSRLSRTGRFQCSNESLNQLVHCVEWSQWSNFVDIPTDCPQRERAGWTGDMNVFQETANYMVDTRKFLSKWMRDFVGMQDDKGGLPYIVPDVPAIGASRSSAGWSDAISTIPLKQYECYGDKQMIEECYEAAKRFVEFNRKRAGHKPIRHILWQGNYQRYILDTGFHYGEWLEPGSDNIKDALKAMIAPDAEVATAWFYYSAANVAQMAHILGKHEDEKTYIQLSHQIKNAYQKQFLRHGTVDSTRMCKYVRPLYMGLADGNQAKQIAQQLNQMCIDRNYHVGTGFLTTYQLLPVLAAYGYVDTAYKILMNPNRPGWLYEVTKGATTIWEGWDAILEDGTLKPLSQNHYSPGTVISWLYSTVAGIRPAAPGYQRIKIQPVPGGNLSWVKCNFHSVQGDISVEWTEQESHFQLIVQIPEGVCAEVIMPNGEKYSNATSGTYTCEIK